MTTISIESLRDLETALEKAIDEIKHNEDGKALFRLGTLKENLTKSLKEIEINGNQN